jgi:hypothetical protein
VPESHRPLSLIFTVICGLGLAAPGAAAERLIDIRRSTVTVHVFVPAAAHALADHHIIQAPLSEGTFDEAIPHFQLVIDGGRLRVLDPGRSARQRRQVQSRMLGPDVLDVNRFRWISFHSVTIEPLGVDQWLVLGELGLHGTVRPLTMNVARKGDRYKGSVKVRQSDYGIVPLSLAGGVVRVMDDIEIDFDILVTGRLAAVAPEPAAAPDTLLK